MRISTRGRYALRFMIDLAQHSGPDFITLKDVSGRQGISVKYLEQITSLLSKFGLLLSVRGPSGGYKLARKPEEYTAGEILRVTEGDMAPVACLAEKVNSCPRKASCPTLSFWEGLDGVIRNYLDGTTLKDLADATPPVPLAVDGFTEESAPCNL
ncbi:MAG: Rrf2 family transcriptional regulator [Treponema sp.]|nr:Rrf2 family transcriptional regulator [Treponema sp.]